MRLTEWTEDVSFGINFLTVWNILLTVGLGVVLYRCFTL